ncbi:MAG TPA: zinc-binding dehydrogenase [Candidatus Eisenbacteria bacterium]
MLHRPGPPRNLRVEEIPDPVAGPGELLVEIKAAGVNFADVLARQGLYPEAPERPFIPGFESSGEVLALGEGANGFRIGQRVLAFHRAGGYAERIAVPAANVLAIPDSLSSQSAVVLPLNYGTAYVALHRTGPLEPGMRVFLHAAAGGVGLAVVDLARRAGLEVVGAASSHFKRERLQAEGVKHVVDSRRAHVDRVARNLYGKDGGFDIVIDSIGGRSIGEGLRALRAGGRLVSCGVARISKRGILGALGLWLTTPRIDALRMLMWSRGFYGLNLAPLMRDPARARAILEELIALTASGEIHPEPGRVMPLADAGTAHQLLERRRNVGKIVLRV